MSHAKFERYDAYKNNGVEWLGEVPAHWDMKRLKDIKSSISNAFVDGPFGSNLKTEHFVENGAVYVIDSGFITSGKFEKKREFKTVSFEHFLTVRRSECCHEDIIISKIGANFGMSGILPKLDKPSLVSGNTLKISINKNNFVLKFIHYQLLNLKVNGIFDLLVKGSAQPALSLGLLNSVTFPVPPLLHEQTAIATYLDTKTEQIDRKIDLLTQKATQYGKLKQSLINETVTRGLDKSVAMKDSGVEWIGEMPEHWEVKRIKDLSMLQSGDSIVSEQIEEEGKYPVYGGNGLRGYYSKYTNNGEYILIGRQGALCGNINYASGKFWASEHAVVAYLKCSIDMKWYGEMLRIMNLNQYSLAAAQPGLAMDRIKRLLLPVPPLQEQKTIADYLDTKTAHIDRIVEIINTQIDKLKELRKTLINDVVTGKIKVPQ